MSEQSLYLRIIGPEAEAWTLPLRGLLRVAEAIYASGMTLRNARYDRRGPQVSLGVPTISVGNLTVGGTGKTPFVIELVRRLDKMGRSPAVVSRGYGAGDDDPNDEERVIRQSCPGVVCVSASNRAMAGEMALQRLGADVIVLDDGFQHRRLGRTLDIVLVDATCPFGFDHLLPRGLLREPVESLQRADVVVVTRCDQASPAALTRIEARLRDAAPDATHLKCTHRVTSVERLDGAVVESSLDGKRAVLFAAIGRPQAFATTVRTLGVEVVAEQWWPDHHRYRRRDLDAILRPGRFPPHDLVITTQKDAVKLSALGGAGLSEVLVAKIAIDFMGDGGTMLQQMLESAVGTA